MLSLQRREGPPMKDRISRVCRASLASVALAAALAAASPSAQQQPPFRAGINYVRVDVIVSDKAGTPVGDLKQTDFEVFEDGKPQTIDTFRLVKIDSAAPVETQR